MRYKNIKIDKIIERSALMKVFDLQNIVMDFHTMTSHAAMKSLRKTQSACFVEEQAQNAVLRSFHASNFVQPRFLVRLWQPTGHRSGGRSAAWSRRIEDVHDGESLRRSWLTSTFH